MKHPLAEATRRIVPAESGLRDPERWVRERLVARVFRGQKIGREWWMTDADIEDAERKLYPQPPQPSAEAEPEKQQALSVVDGLSSVARRRVRVGAAS